MYKALYIHADNDISFFDKFNYIKEFKCVTMHSRDDERFMSRLLKLYSDNGFSCDMGDFNAGQNIIYFWKKSRLIYYYTDFEIFQTTDNDYARLFFDIDVVIFQRFLPQYERREYMKYMLLPIQCIEYDIYTMRYSEWTANNRGEFNNFPMTMSLDLELMLDDPDDN